LNSFFFAFTEALWNLNGSVLRRALSDYSAASHLHSDWGPAHPRLYMYTIDWTATCYLADFSHLAAHCPQWWRRGPAKNSPWLSAPPFLHFSVNLQATRLFIRGFSSHATVLTNTKQLPFGQWLNASGVHLVNW
jgi:hypothetical protein